MSTPVTGTNVLAYEEKSILICAYDEKKNQYEDKGQYQEDVNAASSGDFESPANSKGSSAYFEKIIFNQTVEKEKEKALQIFYSRQNFNAKITETSNNLKKDFPVFDSTINLDLRKKELKVALPSHANQKLDIKTLREIGMRFLKDQPEHHALELCVKFDFGMKTVQNPHLHRKVLVYGNGTVFEYLPKNHVNRQKEAKDLPTTQDEKNPRSGFVYTQSGQKIPGFMLYDEKEEALSTEFYAKLKGCPDVFVTQEVTSKKYNPKTRVIQLYVDSNGRTLIHEFKKEPNNPILIWLMAHYFEQVCNLLAIAQKEKVGLADVKYENTLINIKKELLRQLRKEKDKQIPESMWEFIAYIIDTFHRFVGSESYQSQIAKLPGGSVRSDIQCRPPEGADRAGLRLAYTPAWDTFGFGILMIQAAIIRDKRSVRDPDPTKNPLHMLYGFGEKINKLGQKEKIMKPNKNPDIHGAVVYAQSLIDQEKDPLLKEFCTFCLEMYQICCKLDPLQRPIRDDLVTKFYEIKKRFPKPFEKPVATVVN